MLRSLHTWIEEDGSFQIRVLLCADVETPAFTEEQFYTLHIN